MLENKSVQFSQGFDLTADEVFAKYEGMTEYIAITVPSTIYNQSVDNTEWVNRIAQYMSEMFGGATAYEAHGGYVADSGEYISEKVNVVKSFTDKMTGELARRVIALANDLKGAMQQECVAVEYNGKMMFV